MGRLERFYEDSFGTKQSRGELYTGFFLIVGGIILAIVGIAIWSSVAEDKSLQGFNTREIAGIIASLGPPVILLGIAVALPSKWGMRILDGVGILFCLLGTALFMVLYPLKWNTGTGDEVWGILAYVAGVAILLASTVASLIGYYVARATGGGGTGTSDAGATNYDYDIPDSVIEKDIELAMKRYSVSWGGEGGSGSKSGVQFDVKDDFAPGTVIGGKGIARSIQLDSPQVDTATEKLRGLRGGKSGTISTSEVDSQTAALLKFRKTKAAQEAAKPRGFWARLKAALKRLFSNPPSKPMHSAGSAGAPKAPSVRTPPSK